MKDKILAVVLILIAALAMFSLNQGDSQSQLFDEWKKTYGYQWEPVEDAYRKIIFLKNVELMHKHNADPSQTYKMGVNQFTAFTDKEFVETFLDTNSYKDIPLVTAVDEELQNLGDIDWTTKGGVTPVKNQGQCGSCWAFSATGSSESWNKLKKGSTISLAEQQLVDCSGSYGNHGCNGGYPSAALKYIRDKGITTTSSYPYTARTGTCKTSGGSFKISSYGSTRGCSSIQNAVNAQPLSVCVDATNWSRYSSGVFSNCGKSINHAVLLVGYTSSYWKIKNSWGTSWGESGFIRTAQGDTCGMCSYEAVWPK